MKWFFRTMLAALIVMSLGDQAKTADDKNAQAILEKAIKALGGQDKLSQIKAATWQIQGKITSNGNDSEYTSTLTVQGLDRFRATFESEFNGRKFKIVTVLAGAKGWRKAGVRKMEIGKSELADQRRAVYLELVPMFPVSLQDKGFKIAAGGETKIGDKPSIGLKVTGPEGKDFHLYFSKDSGLPIMLTAKMIGFTEETTFADYKEFAGIKIATKVVSKRDGEKFMQSQITEFKVLDKVDPKTFEEPN